MQKPLLLLIGKRRSIGPNQHNVKPIEQALTLKDITLQNTSKPILSSTKRTAFNGLIIVWLEGYYERQQTVDLNLPRLSNGVWLCDIEVIMSIQLTILVDNAAVDSRARTEHGLAIWIEGLAKPMLFDAAATPEVLLANSELMGVNLASAEGIIVSHGHSDHTGSLHALSQLKPGLTCFIQSWAFARRWTDKPGHSLKEISCPHSACRLQEAGMRFQYMQAPEMLQEGLIISGPVGGPPWGSESFVILKGQEMHCDCFEDEQFALVRGQAGWTIISGCCHRGLKNTLRCARFLVHGQPITGIVGGLHLRRADQAQLAEALDQLRLLGDVDIYPCHCTGAEATEYLSANLPGKVHPAGVGTRIELA